MSIILVLLFATIVISDNISNSSNIFIPTNDWQVVNEGQTLPQGLHYRINLSSGLKEAKLLNENENKLNALSVTGNQNTQKEAIIDVKELKEKLQNIKNENTQESENEIKQKFRSMDELKNLMKDNNFNIKTELEVIKKLLQEYKELGALTDVNVNKALSILQDLEYLVHKIDNGIEFVKLQGIEIIVLPNLDNSTEELTIQTLELLGACMQNNKKVQQLIFDYSIGQKLLNLIDIGSNKIKNKAIYTLGCLIRNFPHAQQKLMVEIGSPIIRKVLNDFQEPDMKVKLRIITLLEDLINEHSSTVDVQKVLESIEFCKNIEILIINSKNSFLGDHDNIEKLLRALYSASKFCHNDMALTSSFKSVMLDLSNFYLKLANEEKLNTDEPDNYYSEILNLLNLLTESLKIHKKQEL